MSWDKITSQEFISVVVRGYFRFKQDVDVVIGDSTFPLHKNVLELWSEYFRASLASPLTTSNTISIPETEIVRKDAFRHIQAYMYTGNIEINKDRVISLLTTAHYLQIKSVINLCEHYIKKEKTKKTITYDLAVCLAQIDVQDLCRFRDIGTDVIAECFFRSTMKEELMNLSIDVLRRVLGNSNFRVLKEDHLFTILLDWILKDKARYKLCKELLGQVRLGLVSTPVLLKVKEHPQLDTHLKSLLPMLNAMMLSSLHTSYKDQCLQKYKAFYEERNQGLVVTNPSEQVLVSLDYDRKSYVWDSKQHWREGNLDLDSCSSNLVLGDDVLYKLSCDNWIMARLMNSGTWVNMAQLPKCFTKSQPRKRRQHVLVYLRPHLYLLYPEQSLQYDTVHRKWSFFDTKLASWDGFSQAVACRETSKKYCILITGWRRTPTEGRYATHHLCAMGNPEEGWQEVDVGDLLDESNVLKQSFLVQEDQVFYIVKSDGVYRNWPYENRITMNTKWTKVESTEHCGVKMVKNEFRKKRYTVFQDVLLPLQGYSGLVGLDALKSNPTIMHLHYGIKVPDDVDYSYLMVLPMGLC